MILTIPEAARRLSVSRSTIYRLISAGRLPLVRISARRVGIPEREVLALIGGGR